MDSQRKSWPKRTEARVTNEGRKEGTNTSRDLLKFIYRFDVNVKHEDQLNLYINALFIIIIC